MLTPLFEAPRRTPDWRSGLAEIAHQMVGRLLSSVCSSLDNGLGFEAGATCAIRALMASPRHG